MTILVTWQGREQSVSAWARELGIPHATLLYRIKSGVPLDEALSADPLPPRGAPRLYTNEQEHAALLWYRGRDKKHGALTAIAERYGCGIQAAKQMLKRAEARETRSNNVPRETNNQLEIAHG